MLSLAPILKCYTVAWYNLWILSFYLSIFHRKQAFNKTWSQDKFFLSRRYLFINYIYLFIIFIIIQLRDEQLQRFYLLTQDKRYWLRGCQIKFLDPNNFVLAVWKDLPLPGKEEGHFGGAVGWGTCSGYFQIYVCHHQRRFRLFDRIRNSKQSTLPQLQTDLLNTKFLKMYHFMTCLQVNKPNSHLVFLLHLICSHPLHINNFLPKQETKWN